jgi:hypothetical protein
MTLQFENMDKSIKTSAQHDGTSHAMTEVNQQRANGNRPVDTKTANAATANAADDGSIIPANWNRGGGVGIYLGIPPIIGMPPPPVYPPAGPMCRADIIERYPAPHVVGHRLVPCPQPQQQPYYNRGY